MQFNSLIFLVFLSGGTAVYYLLPLRFRRWFLLILSCGFYAYFSIPLFIAGLLLTFLIFRLGIAITAASDEKTRIRFLTCGVVILVLWIFGFKLVPLSIEFLNWQSLRMEALLLPLGVSYYSFKLISYLVDCYYEKISAESDFSVFALHVLFFAQLPSGPIQRSTDFLPQAKEAKDFSFENLIHGSKLVLWGMFKKLVIADRIGAFVDPVYLKPDQYPAFFVFLCPYFFFIQLYADFSGLTDIANGSARIFGYRSPENFMKPFAALNIQDFWRRWHISLSEWLRDYVFMPLRMQLRYYEYTGMVISLTVNMILIGLWHGLSIHFLIFGLIQALYMIASYYTLEKRNELYEKLRVPERLRRLIGQVITFHLVAFSLIFFRIDSITRLTAVGTAILENASVGPPDVLIPLYYKAAVFILILFVILEILVPRYFVNRPDAPRRRFYVVDVAVAAALFVCILLAGVFHGSTFIYNQF